MYGLGLGGSLWPSKDRRDQSPVTTQSSVAKLQKQAVGVGFWGLAEYDLGYLQLTPGPTHESIAATGTKTVMGLPFR